MYKKIIVLLTCIFAILLVGCSDVNSVDYVSSQIKVDILSGEIMEINDSHGGFHGDGLSIIKIKIEDKEFEQKLIDSDVWDIKLSKLIEAFLYGYEENNCSYGPFIADENDNPLIPKVQNAYYFIKDRQENGYDLQELDLLDNPSINVTIAVYDMDTSILYYCEEDT